MSFSNPTSPRAWRSVIVAQVAVASLAIAGALSQTEITGSHVAQAAAVSTADLPQNAPSFAPLIDRVKAAVVSVKVKMVANNGAEAQSGQMGNLPPEIQRFFRQFGGQPDSGGMPEERHPIMAEGSGFFISSDGYIVTNNHVVNHAESVTVTTIDGKILDAKVVGTDPKTDLALLKVTQSGDYPFVTFAKDLPRVGDWVLAIGNPYGLGGTVTAGIISAEGRNIDDGPYDRFLQVDAPMNRGNSGGPTFNMRGEVVGVNTAIFSPSGGSVGIGFAIPSTTAYTVIGALEHSGVVSRGYLGVNIQPVTNEMAKSIGLKTASGASIVDAMHGSPAAEAGLQSGDVITKLNGKAVEDAADLTLRIGSFKPGDKVELTYLRNGSEKTAQVTLADQKDETVAKADTSQAPKNDSSQSLKVQGETLGIRIAPAKEVEGAGDKGVAIVGVDPNGTAASEGLAAGDVILDVSGKRVSTPEDVKSGIASAKSEGKKTVIMRIQTADGERFVAVLLPKA
jgi:serine protease Do